MKKKDSLKAMFSDSILNDELKLKSRGGVGEIQTRLPRSKGSDGTYVVYDQGGLKPDGKYASHSVAPRSKSVLQG